LTVTTDISEKRKIFYLKNRSYVRESDLSTVKRSSLEPGAVGYEWLVNFSFQEGGYSKITLLKHISYMYNYELLRWGPVKKLKTNIKKIIEKNQNIVYKYLYSLGGRAASQKRGWTQPIFIGHDEIGNIVKIVCDKLYLR